MAKETAPKEGQNVLYIVNYVLLLLTGILVYVTEGQKNKRMKMHSLQAIFLGIIAIVVAWIPVINLVGFLIWIYGIYIGIKAYYGDDVDVPVLGDYAKKYSA